LSVKKRHLQGKELDRQLASSPIRMKGGNLKKVLSACRTAFARYVLSSFQVLLRWLRDRSLLEFISLLLIVALLVQVGRDYRHHTVMIDPIVVPKTFEDRGYTPQAFSNAVRDEIDTIRRASMTTVTKSEGVNGRQNFSSIIKESIAVANTQDSPDIEIPETKLSFRTVTDFIERLLQFQPRHISGEITILTDLTDAPTTLRSTSRIRSQMSITMRVTQMRNGDDRLPRVSATSRVDPTLAVHESALAVLELTEPHVLAIWEYEKNNDPKRALELAGECQGDLEKWGWLIQGIILEDRANLQEDRSMYDEAIAKYERAHQIDPDWSYPFNNWGNVLAEQKDYDEAIRKYKDAISRDPRYADAYDGWGEVLQSKHDNRGAIAMYRRAIELDPKMAVAYNDWGTALDSTNDHDGAIARYQKAIELDPTLAVAWTNWGSTLYSKNDYDGAVAKFKKAMELDPNVAGVYDDWGNALANKSDYDGAIVKYQKAIALDPKVAGVYDHWGIALGNKSDYDGAIVKYQKAIALDPKVAGVYDHWGNALGNKNDYDGAIAKFQKAMELDPKVAGVYNDWGNALTHKNDYDGAIAKYQKAIELDPKVAGVYDDWGNALTHKNDYDGAIAKVQKAIELDATKAVFHKHLALCFEATGMHSQAAAQQMIADRLDTQHR